MIYIAVIFTLITIFAGPWYTEAGYSWIQHSVSELAGQHTHNAWIMRLGLFSLGSASMWGYWSQRHKFNIFFCLFGFFIALSALFPHKPFIPEKPSSQLLDDIHSWCASLGGLSAVLGFVMLSMTNKNPWRKLLYGAIAALYTALPAAMFFVPTVQGALQRVLFVTYIGWVLFDNSFDNYANQPSRKES